MNKIIPIALTLGCIGAGAATSNYDLLGRKGSQMNSPMVYRNVDYSKVKKDEQHQFGPSLESRTLAKRSSGIVNTSNAKAIVGRYGPRGYYFRACSSGSGCGEFVSMGFGANSLTTYLNNVNQHFIFTQKDGLSSAPYTLYSAGPSLSYLSGYSMVETPYDFNYPSRIYASYRSLYDINQLTHRVYAYSGSTNGVYLDAEALPTRLNPNTLSSSEFLPAGQHVYADEYYSTPEYEMRASKAYKALRTFSDRTAPFVGTNRSQNPSEKNPQVYMGLVPPKGISSSAWYGATTLDNYIYEKRTIEIVGAGNSGGNLYKDAYAVNAITVGAVDPSSGKVTSTSAKNRPMYCRQCYSSTYNKPEVYAYTNYYIDDYKRVYTKQSSGSETYYPYHENTEAAAALTAGMVSTMLSYNEFYKWHPEVVKAVLVNRKLREGSKPLTYDDMVLDQTNPEKMHHSFYYIGDVNTLMNTYYDSGKKEIRLHFGRGELVGEHSDASSVDGFCATISWLNSGTDIYKYGKLPQNFEIYGYAKNGNINMSSLHYQNKNDASDWDDSLKGSSYKRICVADGMGASEFAIRIVLDEEDTRSENYGQMVLGLDIRPIFPW